MPDFPGHDRREERRERRRGRRLVRDGDSYQEGEGVELETPPAREAPPVEVQGEPWGWTKTGDRPRGWPGPDHSHDDPGPFDGAWEPPERGAQ